MIHYLGSLSSGSAVPAFTLNLDKFLTTLNMLIADLEAEKVALAQDAAALLADILSIEGDLIAALVFKTDIANQLLAIAANFVESIKSIINGELLESLRAPRLERFHS